MTRDIQSLVRQWQDQLTAVSRNLGELNEAETTRIMRARLRSSGDDAYCGITLEQATLAAANLDSLWDDYLAMGRVIEEALDLLKKHGVFRDYSEQIKTLLESKSVATNVMQVPLTQRALTGSTNVATQLTLPEAVAQMTGRFAQVRDSVARLQAAEDGLAPRLAVLQEEAVALESWASALGAVVPADLTKVSLSQLTNDPLGTLAQVDAVQARLDELRTTLHGCEQDRLNVRKSLDEQHQQLDALKELASRSRRAIEESRARLADPAPFIEPATEQALASLQSWLATLEELFTASATQPAKFSALKVGVAKCTATLAAALALEQAHYARNRSSLDELDELRGRLDAYRAKARALSARGVKLDATTLELKHQAKAALAAHPTHLSEVRRLVQGFELALSASSQHH